MKVIVIHNQKGGVAKTTTALNFAVALGQRDKKVLLVDLDMQANLSKYASSDFVDIDKQKYSVVDVVRGRASFADVISPLTQNVDIIYAAPSLAELSVSVLKFDFSSLAYDYVIIDCPPTLTGTVISAFQSCDEIIIPTDCDRLSFDGLMSDIETVSSFNVNIAGVLVTRYTERYNAVKIFIEGLLENSDKMGFYVYDTRIRENVAVYESRLNQVNIFEHDPNCAAALDYAKFTDEYLSRGA